MLKTAAIIFVIFLIPPLLLRYRPRWIAAFNLKVTNRITAPFVTWLPGFGVITHIGRKSARPYRTPVNVFQRGSEYVFFLTYGSDVQWVKNVVAKGSCSIETHGRVVELVEPRLITDPELRPAPPLVRFVERRIAGVTQYLRMRASQPK